MLTYREALDYIYSFTDYERTPAQRYSPENFDLAREGRLLDLLDNPHRRFKSIHIAGTKGKGSTAAMIASILHAAGYRTGLYTSPHMHTFRERIRLDGEMIGRAQVAALVERLRPLVEGIEGITTFEIMTAMAFLYFVERNVDFAVLEVGLGGRLDATNVVTPLVSVITPLSYDHTEILGTTLAEIAREKAGIIKDGALVVSAPQPPEAMAVIEEVCRGRGAELFVVGRDWKWEAKEASLEGQSFKVQGPRFKVQGLNLWIPLLGRHELTNATAAVAAVELLSQRGVTISPESVKEGLQQVHWPGRLEILGRSPFVVVDSAHNADSAQKLVAALREYFTYERLFLIFGASADKDIEGMMREIFPLAQRVIVTKARHPRAADPRVLEGKASTLGRKVAVSDDVAEALSLALGETSPGDLVCATGSIFVVAEAREAWLRSYGGEVPEVDPS